jgi:L-glutamine-phosphate cytidylyltransferase
VRGLILAAGRGSRMGALTDASPKCLVEIGGRSLLDRQMTALREAGCAEIGIVQGWQGHLLKGYGLVGFENPRWQSSNMVRSLECAAAWLAHEVCLVSYSDIFYPAAAATKLASCTQDLAIAYDPDWLALWRQRFADPLADAETFRRSPDGSLLEIGGKTDDAAQIEGQYMGLLRFAPAGWKQVAAYLATLPPATADRLDMTGLLKALLAQGTAIHAVAIDGPWGEVDSAADLELYRTWSI